MREIRAPHQAVDADKMPRHHPDPIVLKSCRDLAPKIVTGRIRNRLLFEVSILLIRMVKALKKMRDPSDIVFDRYQPETGKAFKHAAEYNFGKRPLDRMMQ